MVLGPNELGLGRHEGSQGLTGVGDVLAEGRDLLGEPVPSYYLGPLQPTLQFGDPWGSQLCD